MENFLQKVSSQGEAYNSGFFTLDAGSAARKLADLRSRDPLFPYWKCLQAAAVLGARKVSVKVGRSSTDMVIFSDSELPDPREFCNTIPAHDHVLEPLQSAALALASEIDGRVSWSVNSKAAVLSSNAYQFMEPANSLGGHQLALHHQWSGGGFRELLRGSRRRLEILHGLQRRAPFLPVEFELEGRIDRLSLGGILLGQNPESAYAVFYRACEADDPERFLTESFPPNAFRDVAQMSGGQAELKTDPTSTLSTVLGLEGLPHRKMSFQVGKSAIEIDGMVAAPFELPSERIAVSWTSGKRRGPAYYCKEAMALGVERTGECGIGVVDRGVLLGVWPTPLGVPATLVVIPRGHLKVDLGGSTLVDNALWQKTQRDVAARTQARLSLLWSFVMPGSSFENRFKTDLENWLNEA